MNQAALSEVASPDPNHKQKWMEKHGFVEDSEGKFLVNEFEGQIPVTSDKLLENIRYNVFNVDYTPLFTAPYNERKFVMICGGPSLADHLDEIREKASKPDEYFVVCSNMTGGYLLDHDIVPHAHFIIDPQAKKRYDIRAGKTSPRTEYWINAACDPSVFQELQEQGIKPFMFLADFEAEGKARQAVKESLRPNQPGMMAIQGGTMAGLRAINLADALGFRHIEYYGFDATVRIHGDKAQPYAYEKKRGEAIIEVSCDRCEEKFTTTLIFQRQVNEFLSWTSSMPWIKIDIFGGGLIAHAQNHLMGIQAAADDQVPYRFTPEYADLQRQLHTKGDYGVTGHQFTPSIFHAVCQLAKKNGKVDVLDYGSAAGNTMTEVENRFWIPPTVSTYCYDPFVAEFSGEPKPADIVICTDVLEHVEPQCTAAVLDHIRDLTKELVIFSISIKPAQKVLADGRNAHINLRSIAYWLKQIKKRFITSEVKVDADEVLLVVGQSIEGVRDTLRKLKDGTI